MGNSQAELEYLEKAFKIQSQKLGLRHFATATTLLNMGTAHVTLGNIREGLKQQKAALKAFEQIYKEEHLHKIKCYQKIGWTYYQLAKYQKALVYQEKALSCARSLFGENNSDTAIAYNDLSITYSLLDRHQEALTHAEKAVEIGQRLSGGQPNPRFTPFYAVLGLAYADLGQFDKALEYVELGLKIEIAQYGENHPEIAKRYDNIGRIYYLKNDNQKALEYQEKALAIYEKAFGEAHPQTIICYNNIGLSHGFLSKPQLAIELLEKAISGWLKYASKNSEKKEILFNTGQEIARLLWLDAATLISQDMIQKVQLVDAYVKTKGFFLKGIKADGNCFLHAFLESYKTLSRKIPLLDQQPHPVSFLREMIAAKLKLTPIGLDRAQQILDDGEWLTAMGEGDLLASALSIPMRILTVNLDQTGGGVSDMLTFPDTTQPQQDWEDINQEERPQEYIFIVDLGGHFIYATPNRLVNEELKSPLDHHPQLGIYYNNAGGTHYKLGNYEKALIYQKKSLEIRLKAFGKINLQTAYFYEDLGLTYTCLNDHEKALENYQMVLEIRLELLGKKHTNTAVTYVRLGMAYKSLRKYDQALEPLKECLAICGELYGESSLDAAAAHFQLGETYDLLCQYSLALEHFSAALQIRKKLLDENHNDIRNCFYKVGRAYKNMNEYAQALQSFKNYFEISRPDEFTLGESAADYQLAEVYEFLGQYSSALEHFSGAQQIMKKLLDENHYDICSCFHKVGYMHFKLGHIKRP